MKPESAPGSQSFLQIQKHEMTADLVIAELTRIAFANIFD